MRNGPEPGVGRWCLLVLLGASLGLIGCVSDDARRVPRRPVLSDLSVGRSSLSVRLVQGGELVAPSRADGGFTLDAAPFALRLSGDTDLVDLVAVTGPGDLRPLADAREVGRPVVIYTGTAFAFHNADLPVWPGRAEVAELTADGLVAQRLTHEARAAYLSSYVAQRVDGRGLLLLSPRASLPESGAGEAEVVVRTVGGRPLEPGARFTLLVLLRDPIGERFYEVGWRAYPVTVR